uniref:Uncharacterized protein n=1 Tax=Accipiter nisus TaxID=211598 RepID=A0A8B9M0M5_9AVES
DHGIFIAGLCSGVIYLNHPSVMLFFKKNLKSQTKKKKTQKLAKYFSFLHEGYFLSILSYSNFEQLVVVTNLVVSSHPWVIAGDECCWGTATEQSHDASQMAGQTSFALLFSQAG